MQIQIKWRLMYLLWLNSTILSLEGNDHISQEMKSTSSTPIQNREPNDNQYSCVAKDSLLQKSTTEVSVNEIDEDIIHKLATRMKLSNEIGVYKRENEVTVLQVERWNQIVNTMINMGKPLGLSKQFMHKFLDMIHEESISRQYSLMNKSLEQTSSNPN